MPYEPFSIEPGSLVNAGGGPPTHFTDGQQYLWEVSSVKPTAEDATGTGINWHLVAKNGPDNIGATLHNYTSFSEKSRAFLKAQVEIVGLPAKAVEVLFAGELPYAQFAANVKILDTKAKGKQFCSLVVDDVQGGYTNSKLVIDSFLPAKDFVKTAAAPKAAAPKAAPAAAPVAAPAESSAETDEELTRKFDEMLAAASA